MNAVAYLRRSTERQEASIPDQRTAVRKYAKDHGYRIVREYVDDAISGNDTKARVAFRQMIADAAGGEFAVILVHDESRFGRFDLLEMGFWVQPLRAAGVVLETCFEGRIKWDDFAGRVMSALKTEQHNGYLYNLSRDSRRGVRSRAEAGRVVSSRPPIGYLLVDGKYLIDHSRSDVVQRIFADYLGGRSANGIARDLNSDGVPTLTGVPWVSTTILHILRNEVYVGVYVFSKWSRAKYNPLRPLKGYRVPGEPVRFENHHPPLISRKDFNAAQVALRTRRRNTSPHGGRGPFALSGLLICGACGEPMHGRRRDNGKPFYVCSQSIHAPGKCATHAVNQDELLPVIVSQAVATLDSPQFRADAKEQLRGLVNASAKGGSTKSAKVRLAAVTAKIDKAQRRLVEVESEFVPIVQAKLRELAIEHERITKELEMAQKPIRSLLQEADDRIDAALAALETLHRTVGSIPAGDVQRRLAMLLERVTVFVDRVKSTPTRGAFELRSVEIVIKAEK